MPKFRYYQAFSCMFHQILYKSLFFNKNLMYLIIILISLIFTSVKILFGGAFSTQNEVTMHILDSLPYRFSYLLIALKSRIEPQNHNSKKVYILQYILIKHCTFVNFRMNLHGPRVWYLCIFLSHQPIDLKDLIKILASAAAIV